MKRQILILLASVLAINLSTVSAKEQPVIKKSKSGICHDTSSRSYKRTKNYVAFNSMEACLKSGGRRPKK